MSKKENAIKGTIEYFMKHKEPIYCDAYKWSSIEEQQATRWLGRKKFIRYKIEGDSYKMWRSKHFYDIWDKIKDLTPKGVYRFLIEEGRKKCLEED